MTHALTVCLGKTGDLLTLLPILKQESTLQHPSPLMVSRDFASVIEGVSYVSPIVFEGGAHELDRAVAEATKITPQFRVAQVCGDPAMLKRQVLNRRPEIKDGKFLGDSFQKSLWQLCDHWGDFTKGWPLVFDKRSPEREQALIEKHLFVPRRGGGFAMTKSRVMLVSTGRQPGVATDAGHFAFKRLLMLLLNKCFNRGWLIVDLDSIVAERFYDLLGLYEKANVLVATDNAPLHLAYACPDLPVCALISDKPTLWNGSAWRPNHIFHCRYGDFAERAEEMIAAIEGLGLAGDHFWAKKIQGRKNVHVWSQYEVNQDNAERHSFAKSNWERRYHKDGNWIDCRIDRGAFGRDTENMKMQGGRYPFLKDVLRAGAQRSSSGDLIVLTRADTCFTDAPIREGWSNRLLKDERGDFHSPWVDYVAVPHSAMERLGELPDLVMGPDLYWSDVLSSWSNVPEISDIVWKQSDLVWMK